MPPDHRGVAVAANGAVIYDLHTETVIREHPLSPELLAEVTGRCDRPIPAVRFGVEYGFDFGYEPGYRHDWEMSPAADRQGNPLPPPRMADLAEIITKPAMKLLAKDLTADAGRDDGRHVSTARRTGDGHPVLPPGRCWRSAAAGVTKATGLAEVAAVHGIAGRRGGRDRRHAQRRADAAMGRPRLRGSPTPTRRPRRRRRGAGPQ